MHQLFFLPRPTFVPTGPLEVSSSLALFEGGIPTQGPNKCSLTQTELTSRVRPNRRCGRTHAQSPLATHGLVLTGGQTTPSTLQRYRAQSACAMTEDNSANTGGDATSRNAAGEGPLTRPDDLTELVRDALREVLPELLGKTDGEDRNTDYSSRRPGKIQPGEEGPLG